MNATTGRKTAFKAGFFAKLAKDGVLPSVFFERTKTAGMEWLANTPGFLYGETKGLANLIGSQALPAAKLLGTLGTAIPVGLGAVTGTLSAKLNAPPEPDMEAIRQEELVKLYQRLTDEIRSRRRTATE